MPLNNNNNNTNLVNTVPRDDFSNWTYTFTKDYHEIANGTNELTAKLSCLAYPNNYTKFSSVNITGAPQEQILQLQAAGSIAAATDDRTCKSKCRKD